MKNIKGKREWKIKNVTIPSKKCNFARKSICAQFYDYGKSNFFKTKLLSNMIFPTLKMI